MNENIQSNPSPTDVSTHLQPGACAGRRCPRDVAARAPLVHCSPRGITLTSIKHKFNTRNLSSYLGNVLGGAKWARSSFLSTLLIKYSGGRTVASAIGELICRAAAAVRATYSITHETLPL
ncbi:hypothetical protein EVAR_38185_1 [Eumeta japonica]|uniref:Uncharacterized protein n=1 Tax=Eumeta variegata TaxID=151549 RepID=A0A4C1WH09_EUMVA|nr:hypothetical protein EVAR_38185_1 [Eumeta japonica]